MSDVLGPKQRQWVDALRSGEYQQGKNLLHSGSGDCCLGVADTVLCLNESCSIMSLPTTYRHLGLRDSNGGFEKPIYFYGIAYYGLTSMNDQGLSFQDIAFIIENYWNLIFTEKV